MLVQVFAATEPQGLNEDINEQLGLWHLLIEIDQIEHTAWIVTVNRSVLTIADFFVNLLGKMNESLHEFNSCHFIMQNVDIKI